MHHQIAFEEHIDFDPDYGGRRFLGNAGKYLPDYATSLKGLEQRYSTFFVWVPPDIISLQLCTPKVVGV
jgi:hypothetical protein